MRSYLTGNFTHDTNTTDCTVFQSTIRQKLTTRAQRSWIGYNTIRYMKVEQGHAEIVGNVIHGRSGQLLGLQITGANTFANIRNNEIFNGSEVALPAAKRCMPWDSSCPVPKAALSAMSRAVEQLESALRGTPGATLLQGLFGALQAAAHVS